MWKSKNWDDFMCLFKFECAKRLKAHSQAIPGDTKITNDTDCLICAIWNMHAFKSCFIFQTLAISNGYPWAVLQFPFNFVFMWDVSETRQGQTGLSFMTSVGRTCPHWACQWKASDQSHPWLLHDEYSMIANTRNGHRSTATFTLSNSPFP